MQRQYCLVRKGPSESPDIKTYWCKPTWFAPHGWWSGVPTNGKPMPLDEARAMKAKLQRERPSYKYTLELAQEVAA